MPSTTTPNMDLTVPTVSQEPGPEYASEINADLSLLDTHDHSTGKGVQITPAGINVNSDFSFVSNNATNLRSTRFVAQGSPLAVASDVGCVYVSGADLYYNDTGGNQIRITQSGAVVGSPGSITSLTSPASASYNAGATKFVWQSAANTAADLDFRSAILRNASASSFGLTLAPPTMSGDYNLTLPPVPAATSFMTLDSSGVMATGPAVANGITRANLAAVGQQVSSTYGGTISSAATTYLSCTISLTGRPVMITFISNDFFTGSQTAAGVLMGTTVASSITSTTFIVSRGGQAITRQLCQTPGNISSSLPPGSFNCMDLLGPIGSQTYTFGVQSTTGSSAGPNGVRMVVYEL